MMGSGTPTSVPLGYLRLPAGCCDSQRPTKQTPTRPAGKKQTEDTAKKNKWMSLCGGGVVNKRIWTVPVWSVCLPRDVVGDRSRFRFCFPRFAPYLLHPSYRPELISPPPLGSRIDVFLAKLDYPLFSCFFARLLYFFPVRTVVGRAACL